MLNFAVAFAKDYNERFVTASIVNIVKDMMDSHLLTGLNPRSQYRIIHVNSIVSRHDRVLAAVESLNGNDAMS